MGKTPKVTVGEDFSYIVKNYLHEKFAKQLSKEEKKGNIRFQVIRDLGLDGQTNFGERGVLIKIKQVRLFENPKSKTTLIATAFNYYIPATSIIRGIHGRAHFRLRSHGCGCILITFIVQSVDI